MVRYHGKGRKPGINDSASMDASQSSIGVKIQANSMAVEQSCEASLTTPDPNSRPHYATCRNSVTCFLELRSTNLQTPANLSRSKDETNRSVNQESQEHFPYHHEISWFEHNVGDQSAAILSNLQPESGGNVREVRGLWKGAAPLCDKSSAMSGRDPRSDINSSLGSLATSEIEHSRRDSDSFRHEFSTREFSKYTKYFSSGQYPLVSWEPESKHVDLKEHDTTDKKRKLEPMENFSGDNELNNTNSTLKDSDILHAHEGTSMNSLEDQATMQEARRSFASRSEFKFARVPVLNRIRRKLTNMPTVTEIEEFFEEDVEKQHQTSFMARYNYDLVNDVPLKGRFEWEKLQQ